jgi:hypothetical protein
MVVFDLTKKEVNLVILDIPTWREAKMDKIYSFKSFQTSTIITLIILFIILKCKKLVFVVVH